MNKNTKGILCFIIILLLFLSLFILNNPIEEFQGGGTDSTTYDIIIVAGQSNAIGVGIRNVCEASDISGCSRIGRNLNVSTYATIGPIDYVRNKYEYVPTIRDANYDKIKMFTYDLDVAGTATATDVSNIIIDLKEPLHHAIYSDDLGRITFATSFAKEYLRNIIPSWSSRKILVVGCAVSGTAIERWEEGSTDDFCGQALTRLQNVKNLLTSNNSSKVVALLWHQGESNAGAIFDGMVTSSAPREERVRLRDIAKNLYKSKLKAVLTRLRNGARRIFTRSSMFPILLGGLSYDAEFYRESHRLRGTRIQNPNRQYRSQMSAVISEVSKPEDPYYIEKSAFVSSDVLPISGFNRRLENNQSISSTGNYFWHTSISDGVGHFSASSMRELGRRYFYYYNLIK